MFSIIKSGLLSFVPGNMPVYEAHPPWNSAQGHITGLALEDRALLAAHTFTARLGRTDEYWVTA